MHVAVALLTEGGGEADRRSGRLEFLGRLRRAEWLLEFGLGLLGSGFRFEISLRGGGLSEEVLGSDGREIGGVGLFWWIEGRRGVLWISLERRVLRRVKRRRGR